MRVAKVMRHFWEEPVLAGPGGSGAVFFSGCTLGCLYCQNADISFLGRGEETDASALRKMMEALIAQGAENIDLVTPTQFLPEILPALTPELPVPVVYNCGGYESVETLRRLEGRVDIYLPDLKYADGTLSLRLSGAADYFPVAAAAIDKEWGIEVCDLALGGLDLAQGDVDAGRDVPCRVLILFSDVDQFSLRRFLVFFNAGVNVIYLK